MESNVCGLELETQRGLGYRRSMHAQVTVVSIVWGFTGDHFRLTLSLGISNRKKPRTRVPPMLGVSNRAVCSVGWIPQHATPVISDYVRILNRITGASGPCATRCVDVVPFQEQPITSCLQNVH